VPFSPICYQFLLLKPSIFLSNATFTCVLSVITETNNATADNCQSQLQPISARTCHCQVTKTIKNTRINATLRDLNQNDILSCDWWRSTVSLLMITTGYTEMWGWQCYWHTQNKTITVLSILFLTFLVSKQEDKHSVPNGNSHHVTDLRNLWNKSGICEQCAAHSCHLEKTTDCFTCDSKYFCAFSCEVINICKAIAASTLTGKSWSANRAFVVNLMASLRTASCLNFISLK